MITGPLRNQVDRIWDAFWSGGISNPMTVIEQFTFLLFLKQLDERQASAEFQRTLGVDAADVIPANSLHLRWRELMQIPDGSQRRQVIDTEVFPFLREGLGSAGFARHMRNATFGIDSPGTLLTVMELIDALSFPNKDMAGDLYEYMLSKLAASGTNGQFRTVSHVIDLMVNLMAPAPHERVIDPACGTAGFLVGSAEWTKDHHRDALLDPRTREFFPIQALTGFDFDATMVRIAAMNMFMHGVTDPQISYQDSLQQLPSGHDENYDIVLANPPFAGSIDANALDPALSEKFTSKKTELLFVQRFLQLLRPGGRAAVIVPEGVLFGSTRAHKALRKQLIDDHRLDAIIKLPSGTFKPYSGVSTAILCFTKTNSGGTEDVWFYEVRADGYSLDDKRTPLLAPHLLGPVPLEKEPDPELVDEHLDPTTLTPEQHESNNLPDVLNRWAQRTGPERDRARTEQSFAVPIDEIRNANYDLSMNRYKEIVFEAAGTRDPLEILAEIRALDSEITAGIDELDQMLRGERK
ncbi:putative type I restriction enzymeP M protein [Corynebacterium atrinae]|uniref:class I SAM-dependent DNA methyltransferase n=1 Tax=Corynebacterium atrinae TaxID=1336740 RepID=UPI0025B38747|nr:class I SAM-dependent DNA methyltransferase [Corynebacterium atrinae]WJY62226.1 putative type I restriction enzymeP M protein [Corynebacterium atrinae]